MKTLLPLLFVAFATKFSFSQTLYLGLNKDNDVTPDYIDKKANDLYVYLKKYYGKSFTLTSSKGDRIGYRDSIFNNTNSILLLSAYKYINHKQKNEDVVELFICLHSDCSENIFYPTYIICNRKAKVNLLTNFSRVSKINFVDECSSSGYVTALKHLSSNGLIAAPSLKSIESRTIKTCNCGSHTKVINEIDKDTSGTEIGFTSVLPDTTKSRNVEILSECSVSSPGHVWVISKDLLAYKKGIEAWIEATVAEAGFAKNIPFVKGIVPFDTIYHKNVYNNFSGYMQEIQKYKNCSTTIDSKPIEDMQSVTKKIFEIGKNTLIVLVILIVFIAVLHKYLINRRTSNLIKLKAKQKDSSTSTDDEETYKKRFWFIDRIFSFIASLIFLIGMELIGIQVELKMSHEYNDINSLVRDIPIIILLINVTLAVLTELGKPIKYIVNKLIFGIKLLFDTIVDSLKKGKKDD